MKPCSVFAGIAAALLLLSAGQSCAAEDKAAPKAAAVKLVDINSASKQDLAKLPGVSAADVDKIVAGRPYGSKAHLLTHKVLSPDTYQGLSKLVIARQPSKDAGKNAELQKKK